MMKTILVRIIIALALSSCALPQPTAVERQDFVSRREVLIARLVRQSQEDFTRGRMFDAELGLRKALLLAPEVTQLALNLGRTLARNGQHDEADKVFERVLVKKPKDVSILNFAGESFFEGGSFELAQRYLERASDNLSPLAWEEKNANKRAEQLALIELTHKNLSTVAFRAGRLIEALCHMHQAFEAQPTIENFLRIIRLETAQGSLPNAMMRMDQYLTVNAGLSDARFYLLRSLLRYALDLKDKALEDLNAALKREESIGEYPQELHLMSDALIIPEVVEGEEPVEVDEEDGDLAALKDAQRLYLPSTILALFDQKQADREAARQDE